MEDKLTNIHGLARGLKLPAAWLKAEAMAGRIPSLVVGRQRRYSPKAVEQVLLERSAIPKAESPDELYTVGQIAKRLGVSKHRLTYAVEQYRIQPRRRIGIVRVWSGDQIPVIESALKRIASNREEPLP